MKGKDHAGYFQTIPSQEKRAVEVKEKISQEVQTERTQDWCGNLLGWLSNNETVMLTVHNGEMILSGSREDIQTAFPTIRDVLSVKHLDTVVPTSGGREVVEVGGLYVDVEWYKPWEMIISKLNYRMLDVSCIDKLLRQFSGGSNTPNLWVLLHLSKILDKRPGVPQPGTPAYSRAAADGSLSERRQNDALRSKVSEAIEEMSEGIEPGQLDQWYVDRAVMLGAWYVK